MNRIVIFGAAGFIGTNLALKLAQKDSNEIILIDKKLEYFSSVDWCKYQNVKLFSSSLDFNSDFKQILRKGDIVFHLVSTTMPSNTNLNIAEELQANIVFTSLLLEECVKTGVAKVVFISSGGTVYGKDVSCPIIETHKTDPICSYGLQKLTIEKLLNIYKYLYKLDFVVARLANPYGPYQRPNGLLGAVTTFVYRALNNQVINIYGDGSVVRDYIYIDDAVNAVIKLSTNTTKHSVYNIGSSVGLSLNQIINSIEEVLKIKTEVCYGSGRKADVPINTLDINRYESEFGKLINIGIEEGLLKTANYLKNLR